MTSTHRRIVSLFPGATETIAALGLADRLVGISHECDWPPEVQHLPRVTATPIDPTAPSAKIDAEVRRLAAAGRRVIGLEAERLRTLRPDTIVSQALCDVCAVADGEAVTLARAMNPAPEVITLTGRTLPEVFQDIALLGEALGASREGVDLRRRLERSLEELRAESLTPLPPSVAVVEWLDPPFLAAHWVPEMVEAAGGRNLGRAPGDHSVTTTWETIRGLAPDVIVIALCGFGTERARREVEVMPDGAAREWLAAQRVVFLDGNAYTSRPGPRIIEGIEVLARGLKDVRGER